MRFVACSFVLASMLVFAAPFTAQGQERTIDEIRPSDRPPRGMCRIWLNGVPPGQQPAPTDCATAVRNRPPNARVIFGDDGPGGLAVPRLQRDTDQAEREAQARQERERKQQVEREQRERERRRVQPPHQENERRRSPKVNKRPE